MANPNVAFTNVMEPILASDTTSRTAAELSGNRQPFGAFIMEIKTADDLETPNLPYLHSGISRLSSPLVENKASQANERLQYRIEPINSWDNDILQVSTSNHPLGANHIFIGGGTSFGNGHTHFIAKGIPLMAPASIAEFMHAGVGDYADSIIATAGRAIPSGPFFDLAVGNSYAHPMVPQASDQSGNNFDYSHKINSVLWDSYFCSSLAPRYAPMVSSDQSIAEVWNKFLSRESNLTNSRFRLYADHDNKLDESIIGTDGKVLPQAHQKLGTYLTYEGGFNVNSVSVEAWEAFLSGAQNDNVRLYDLFNKTSLLKDQALSSGDVPFCRTSLPSAPSIRSDITKNNYIGYRVLSSTEIRTLAEEIVKQVKTRGPFLNMSDFINRQLNASSKELSLSGTLQAAIDKTKINEDLESAVDVSAADTNGLNYAFEEAAHGNTAKGSPGWLMQGDLLVSLGSSIYVRGDTFTIRVYGESRDPQDNLRATAYAEAVVQRGIRYVDRNNDPNSTSGLSGLNQVYGRKFRVVHFRWLKGQEI